MKLYRVYNGFTGYCSVHLLVISENEEKAIEIGKNKFKELSEKNIHKKAYYKNISAELVFENTEVESVEIKEFEG